MLKTTLLSKFILFALLISVNISAQEVPNGGFEQWNGNTPSGWLAGNADGITFVTPSTDPMSGQFAVRLEPIDIFTNLVPAVISAGDDGGGFPVSERYMQLSLYYKFHKSISTAALYVSVGFKKGENGIGAGTIIITTETENYTPVTIPVTYINEEIPDLAIIYIQVSDQDLSPAADGSYAEIDNISFNPITNVDDKELNLNDFTLKQNYPNPFNPTTKISWQSPENGHQVLKVYDITGKEVATLVDEDKPAGSYTVDFDGSGLSSGVYFYQLTAGSYFATKKMILMK